MKSGNAKRGALRWIGYHVRHNAIALTALFLALGSGAYAASSLPKHSVGTKQLKANAVRSAQVKNRSLLAKDFKAGQLPQGAPGAPGPRGSQGPAGPPGVSGYQIVSQTEEHAASFQFTASCPAGKRVVGGGHNWVDGSTDVWFWESAPDSSGTGWLVRGIVNRGGAESIITAYAICVNVS